MIDVFKPVIVTLLVFLCTIAAVAQTASSVQVAKALGEVKGNVVAVVDGEQQTIAGDAFQAWLVDGGGAIIYSTGDGAGGYEREGQALWRYDVGEGCVRKVMTELYVVNKVVEAQSASGEDALLVTMVDGGLGAPHIAVVDPDRGQVWRHTYARFVGVRNGRIAVALYSPEDFEGGQPEPDQLIYRDIGALLQRTANPFVPVQVTGRVASIVGTATYRERIALPPEAVLEVELVDAVSGRRITRNTVLNPGQVPISFELFYDPNLINPDREYRVNARITVGNQVWFRNTTAYPVITGGNANQVEMVLTRA